MGTQEQGPKRDVLPRLAGSFLFAAGSADDAVRAGD